MFTKKAFQKNMAILVCGALVSLFLPSISTPYEVKIPKDETSSMSTIAPNFLYATLSIDPLLEELNQEKNDEAVERTIEGNSKSKKKPKSHD